MAPEVVEGKKYDLSCDLWSLGVIAFFILGGKPPFFGKDEIELVRRISSNNYDFPETDDCKNFSPLSKKFIRGLLKLKPSDRMTPKEALEHPWLSGETSTKVKYPIHKNILV